MRKTMFAVLLTCCFVVLSVSEALRVCADIDLWFGWYAPNIHDPLIDNDGDGYYESVNLCVGVQSTYARSFTVTVYARDHDGVQQSICSSSPRWTEWDDWDKAYEYFAHTKLIVPYHGIWDFRLELRDDVGNLREVVDYGTEPSLTDVKMEGELMALVVRGEDNRIYWRIYDSSSPGTWGAWNAVPTGTTIDSPAASILEVLGEFGWYPSLQIVVRGMDGLSLWHCAINLADNSFSGWDQVAGATNSRPTLCKDTLFVRGLDNRVYYSAYDYYDFKTFGYTWNVVPSGTTCDSPAASHYCMAVRGMDENSLWYAGLTFSGWQLLDGATNSAPTLTDHTWPGYLTPIACSYTYEPIHSILCVRGLDNSLYWIQWTPEHGWYSWARWGSGATCDSPGAATIGFDLHLVVRGMDGHSLWWSKWVGWSLLSGSSPSAPTLAS